MGKSLNKIIILILFLSFVLGMNLRCKTDSSSQTNRYASLDTSNYYTGINACRDCHSNIYDTYIHTGMGLSFDHASPEKSSADFDHHRPVFDSTRNFYYLPYWEDDSLRIMEYRLQGKDTTHQRIETITYIVGSGQHTNSHIINTGGFLNQAPLTFYTQKGQWDLPPGFENGMNSRFSRIIGLECMSCHNSYPDFELGSENKYSFVDRGIGCERCHGPGGKHVNEKREGIIFDTQTQIDYSIVNPAKLPIALQLDVCQRCHIQGNAVLNEGKSFFDFKPGMRLSEVMNVFMPVYRGNPDEHIMASHVERMKLSRCYTESLRMAESSDDNTLYPYKNAMTCVTCHDPHVSVRNTGSQSFNTACGGCHGNNKSTKCSEKPEALRQHQMDCVGCHMPYSGTTDIPHVSVHDHYIRKPIPEGEIQKIRDFVGIACINNPNVNNISRGRAFIAYHEKFGFGPEALDSARRYLPHLSDQDIRIHFRDLIHLSWLEKKYAEVISYVERSGDVLKNLNKPSYDNHDAWTAYRIGESYFQTGNQRECESYYARAYRLAPDFPEFVNKYATILAANGKNGPAIEVLEKSVSAYPKFPSTLSNLGYLILVERGDTTSARRLYDRALALDPDYRQAIINKAGLFLLTGKKRESIQLLKQHLKFNPDHKAANELLSRIQNS